MSAKTLSRLSRWDYLKPFFSWYNLAGCPTALRMFHVCLYVLMIHPGNFYVIFLCSETQSSYHTLVDCDQTWNKNVYNRHYVTKNKEYQAWPSFIHGCVHSLFHVNQDLYLHKTQNWLKLLMERDYSGVMEPSTSYHLWMKKFNPPCSEYSINLANIFCLGYFLCP